MSIASLSIPDDEERNSGKRRRIAQKPLIINDSDNEEEEKPKLVKSNQKMPPNEAKVKRTPRKPKENIYDENTDLRINSLSEISKIKSIDIGKSKHKFFN